MNLWIKGLDSRAVFYLTTSPGSMVPGLFILFFVSAAGGRETSHKQGKQTDSLSPSYIYKFGTLWQVYLPVITYDWLYSSIYFGGSSNKTTQRTLLDVTRNLPRVIKDRHPCRNGTVVITGARWRGQLYFQLAYSLTHFLTDAFRIC